MREASEGFGAELFEGAGEGAGPAAAPRVWFWFWFWPASAPPPSYPSSFRLASITAAPTSPNRSEPLSFFTESSACAMRVGTPRPLLYPPRNTRAQSTPTASSVNASSGAAARGSGENPAVSRSPLFPNAEPFDADAFKASSRLIRSSNTSKSEPSCACVSRIAAATRSAVFIKASAEDESSFSTALRNPFERFRDLANSTLRSGTVPLASPPCLNRSETPCASAAAAKLCSAAASASRVSESVSGFFSSTPPSAASRGASPVLARFASGGGIAVSSSSLCAAVRFPRRDFELSFGPAASKNAAEEGVIPAVPGIPSGDIPSGDGPVVYTPWGGATSPGGLMIIPPLSCVRRSHAARLIRRIPTGLPKASAPAAFAASASASP